MTNLTEAAIRQLATPESFRRGSEYYESGAVLSLARRGDQLLAEVEGSQYEPYRVQVTLTETGIAAAHCSCPYDWSGYCKHIVAVLLAAIHKPEEITERPTLESLLDGLDADRLRAILLHLDRRYPDMADEIEAQVALAQVGPADEPEGLRRRQTPLDPAPFRRQVRGILHRLDHLRASEAYWAVEGVVDDVRAVLNQALPYLEAGDGHNALVVLEAVTGEYLAGWEYLDDSDGFAGDFFGSDLGPLWAEALLSADLSAAERREWRKKLTQWQRELEDYGLEEAFDVAIGALDYWWDYPPLQRVFDGEITERGAWESAAPDYADDLAIARLNVLARQKRFQEYLYLAEAEGQTERYVTMLVQLGRVQEAVEYGLEYLATTDEALALAQALQQRGEVASALRIAEHGLTLEGPKTALARWLRDQAIGMKAFDTALSAAMVAFRESPTLADYQALPNLAGAQWPSLKENLLAHVRQTSGRNPQATIEILLHEGLVDEAIAVADKHPYYMIIEPVVDAAIHVRPDWAIRAACKEAEAIIEAKKADRYRHAVRWLEKACAAYRAAGRENEWCSYLEKLIAEHQRKYSLRPMLEALRKR